MGVQNRVKINAKALNRHAGLRGGVTVGEANSQFRMTSAGYSCNWAEVM